MSSITDTGDTLNRRPTPPKNSGSGGEPGLRLADLDRAFELLAEADSVLAEAAGLLAGFCGSGVAQWLGYVSMPRLVAHRSGRSNRAARVLVRTARFLDQFPVTAEAVRHGALSWGAAEVLSLCTGSGTNNGDDEVLAAAYRDHEADLLAQAGRLDVDGLERLGSGLAASGER